MNDKNIIDLYWERSERAIDETSKKYSAYCWSISYNILHNKEDSEECVNDTFLRTWNAIPSKRPEYLGAFLGKITRNLSLNRYKKYHTEKRGFGQTELVLSELEDCIASAQDVEQEDNERLLIDALNTFLDAQSEMNRVVFIKRYWYLNAIKDICEQCQMGESKVKSMLFRMRNELKTYLEKEGIIVLKAKSYWKRLVKLMIV